MINKEPVSIVTNEDCMLMMGRYPDKFFELAIVDPPYGNKTDVLNIKDGRDNLAKRSDYKGFENVKPSAKYFEELKRVSKNQIVWGGNFFGLEGGYICWNKNGTAFGEAELAYCSMQNSVSVYEYTWNGMIQQNMKNKEERIHPTQKPVGIYKLILSDYDKSGDKILDTHLGSGSSRIAAYKLGFHFWACEIDKEYYEAQEARFKKAIAEPLFDQVKHATQMNWFDAIDGK
jgi:site-specific DNA-methyltransferase (adenine-specific)